jgi:hypothetical protein
VELNAPLIAIWGSSFTIGVVNSVNQSKSGDGLMHSSVIRPIALFGTVAVMVTLTAVVTLFSY